MVDNHKRESWNLMRCEVIRILLEEMLESEIVKELREELREQAEFDVVHKIDKTGRLDWLARAEKC